MSTFHRVPKSRLIYLANEIAATFEGQSAASYYLPFCIEGGKRLSANGKLHDRINYAKRLMRIDGILKESKINKEPENIEQPISALGLVRFIYFTESYIICTHMLLKNYLFII